MPEKPHRGGSHSPEYAILGFLYEHPSHGYNLHQQLITELGHVWHVSQSQTYAILKRLETQGDISSSTLKQEKLPPRQMLEITAAGRRRFEDWLHTPSGNSVRTIRLEFISRLYFARKLFPKMVHTLIEEESADIRSALSRLETAQKSIPAEQPFNRLSLDLRIRQLHSVQSWLIECQKVFEKKSKMRTS
jgi:PadR family transcriptional regulator, regulatory protein AphA